MTSFVGGDELNTVDQDELPRQSHLTGYGAPPARGQRPPLSKKVIPAVFLSVVAVMVVLSFVLSIVASATRHRLNILLGITMLTLLIIQVIMVLLARSGGIPRQKTWFVYVVGLFIIVESVMTNIVMFNA